MPRLCLQCGQYSNGFSATQDIEISATQAVELDCDDVILDYNDREEYDEEVTSGFNDIKCIDCGSSNTKCFDDLDEFEAKRQEIYNSLEEENVEPTLNTWNDVIGDNNEN